jgi:hypothetical protein
MDMSVKEVVSDIIVNAKKVRQIYQKRFLQKKR